MLTGFAGEIVLHIQQFVVLLMYLWGGKDVLILFLKKYPRYFRGQPYCDVRVAGQ